MILCLHFRINFENCYLIYPKTMRNLNLSCFKPHSIQNLDSGMAVSLFDAGIFFSYCINSFRKRDLRLFHSNFTTHFFFKIKHYLRMASFPLGSSTFRITINQNFLALSRFRKSKRISIHLFLNGRSILKRLHTYYIL